MHRECHQTVNNAKASIEVLAFGIILHYCSIKFLRICYLSNTLLFKIGLKDSPPDHQNFSSEESKPNAAYTLTRTNKSQAAVVSFFFHDSSITEQ